MDEEGPECQPEDEHEEALHGGLGVAGDGAEVMGLDLGGGGRGAWGVERIRPRGIGAGGAGEEGGDEEGEGDEEDVIDGFHGRGWHLQRAAVGRERVRRW